MSRSQPSVLRFAAVALALGVVAVTPSAQQYEACNRIAALRIELAPAPAPSSTPGGAPRIPTVPTPTFSAPGPPGAGAVRHDQELLEHADPRHRDNPMFRSEFLECLRRAP